MEWYELRGARVGAVIAVAAVVGFLVWLLAIHDSGDDTSNVTAGAGPVASSETNLVALAAELGHPVYWAGEQDDTKLEVTESKDGRVFVRYLTAGAKIGEPKAKFLTVATYPFQDAYDALKKVAKKPGAIVDKTGDGLVVTNRADPNSVYLAYPDEDLQIEVFDPSPKRALNLTTSGDVQPVG